MVTIGTIQDNPQLVTYGFIAAGVGGAIASISAIGNRIAKYRAGKKGEGAAGTAGTDPGTANVAQPDPGTMNPAAAAAAEPVISSTNSPAPSPRGSVRSRASSNSGTATLDHGNTSESSPVVVRSEPPAPPQQRTASTGGDLEKLMTEISNYKFRQHVDLQDSKNTVSRNTKGLHTPGSVLFGSQQGKVLPKT
jgi:hypothetical protein